MFSCVPSTGIENYTVKDSKSDYVAMLPFEKPIVPAKI